MILIVIGALALLVIYVFATYNKFVTIKTRIGASIQEIGNQLKRQADLIPNLVKSVKGYMKHEREIFKDLTDARKGVMEAVKSKSAQKLVDASAKLQKAFVPINALFENTPELQAAGPTSKLMEELRDTADKLMYSRRTLIDLMADYNVMVVAFPSSLIAKLFSFQKESGFKMPSEAEVTEVKKEELKTPKVKLD